MKRPIAIITARGGSKGLPNKNILDLHGHPLIAWSIMFAHCHPAFDRVLVTTDSLDIASVAKQYNAEVPFIRSAELASDTATTPDVINDVINRCNLRDDDCFILLEPTSPYRTSEDFQSAIDLLGFDDTTKLISVSPADGASPIFQFTLSNDLHPRLSPFLNNVGYVAPRRQDISDSYYLDGSFYGSYVNSFKDDSLFVGPNTKALITNYLSSFEIDSLQELELYKALFAHHGPPSWYHSELNSFRH